MMFKTKEIKKILFIAATPLEIKELERYLQNVSTNESNCFEMFSKELHIQVLITGIGQVNTCINMMRFLRKNHFDLIIDIGIAGSFRHEIVLGTNVLVVKDMPGDFGRELFDGKFQPLQYNFSNGTLTEKVSFIENTTHIEIDSINKLRKVVAVTSNSAHSSQKSTKMLLDLFNPDIETMEGFAFFSVCKSLGAPSMQIRSISNYIPCKSKSAWNIPMAVQNLNQTVIQIIDELS